LPAEVRAVHAGISGHTIVDILARLQYDALVHEPDIIVLAVGINDSLQFAKLGWRNNVPLDDFKTGLAAFAEKIGEVRVVIVGLAPVDEKRTMPIDRDLMFSNKFARIYDETLQRFAVKGGYEYVDVAAVWAVNGGAEALMADGLHPTPQGHELIARAVWKTLQGMLVAA
jgi:acyl-CoA thioesterase-1